MKNSNITGNSFIEHVAQAFGHVYFSYDVAGKVFRYVSPAVEQLCGTKPESVLSDPTALLSFVDKEDRAFLSHQYQKLLLTQEQTQVEFRINKGEEVKWVCIYACLLQDEEAGKQLIGGQAMEITEQKEYTQNIMKYNSKKNSTLEILSHDLAAPFANIQGMIAALEEQVNQDNKDIQQLIEYIK